MTERTPLDGFAGAGHPVSPIAALFPGQGSQHVGMGKSLWENFKLAAETIEEASDACSLKIRKLCLDGPESDLALTENTQPCLLAISVAAFRVAASETGFAPACAAGHSLGEYSALVALGALPLGLAARWVRERGKAMQAAVPVGTGGMAAVLGLEDTLVETLCARAGELAREGLPDAVIVPANFNAPAQVVVAGHAAALDRLAVAAKADERFARAKVIPLNVSAPFHSPLMKPARERMRQLFQLEGNGLTAPRAPLYPNRTARAARERAVILELLEEQVDHPVLWRQTVESLLEGGITRAVEFGPGKILQGLAKRTPSASGKTLEVIRCSDADSIRAGLSS